MMSRIVVIGGAVIGLSARARAGPLRTLVLVTVPLIGPGVFSGSLFAFIAR
jgi:ABC-type Fe3+ transport system permease subunit